MKICYLSNSAIPSNYASSIQIVKMCEAFSQLGNDVVLITRSLNQNKIFKLYDIKSKFIIKVLEKFKKFPIGLKFYLFSIISVYVSFKYKPDIYITRNLFTCFLLVLFRKKIILELHHDLKTESRIVKFLVKKFNFLNSKCIKVIVAITNKVQEVYTKKYSVKKENFMILPSGSSLKSKFKFANNKKNFKIGYFGSLYKSRGIDIIYNLSKIDKSNKYYVYGNLNIFKNLSKFRFRKNLILNQYIPYRNISEIISKMDILLMPYASSITVAGNVGDITEYTSPLKLFDYLTSGKIIICSDFKVLREILVEKKNVIFVKNFTNIYSWKKEIQILKNLNSRQLIISRNNYNLSKKFTLVNRAKKIIENINLS